MLGFSFGKLVFLAFIILVVWYGYRYVQRVEQVRQALKRAVDAATESHRRPGGRAAPGGRSAKLEAEDMVKCRSCGTYVAARGAGRCGRDDCPW